MTEVKEQGQLEVTQQPQAPAPAPSNADMERQLQAARDETARLARIEACQHVGGKITGR